MRYLLDTSVICEPKRDEPSASVLAWLDAQDEVSLYLSSLTFGEIRRAIARLESGRRKAEIELWLEKLRRRFSRRVVSMSERTFLIWGRVYGEYEKRGIVRTAVDAFFEATAIEHDFVLVTRDAEAFEGSPITILNPWED